MDKKISIVVHSGGFHADDIFAVATLMLALGEDSEFSVTRTRDENIINRGDCVVDVGGVYNETANRFDHHQIGGAGVRENGIPYASFGLVWKKFGEELCGNVEIANKIDQKLIQPIDAIDNGVNIIEPIFEGIYPYNVYDFFDVLIPTWKEEGADIDKIFLEAVSYAKIILKREIKKRKDGEEARHIVIEEYNKSKDKRLIVFDRFYPSGETLMEFTEPLFKIYPRQEGTWALEGIKTDHHSFNRRKFLPEIWAGKKDEELENITGISGAVFCHVGRFIAVAKTKEAILKLAAVALNN
jgi:uncharacterized UPF0160 family protein